MHEGLANYTGVALSGMTLQEQARFLATYLETQPDARPSFTRSFAYLSGPAYGVLLDLLDSSWRKKLTAQDDFEILIRQKYGLHEAEPSKARAEERAQKYGGPALRQKEQQRESARQERIARYRKLLVDGPVLILPTRNLQTSFDPNTIQPLESHGTVYPSLKVIDAWGILTVKQGALISADFKKVTVSAPSAPATKPMRGEGWELELKEGWALKKGPREGDWIIIEKK
jgi:hypothetical protein